MDEHLFNEQLKKSFEQPRPIPFDEKDWGQFSQQLDKIMPPTAATPTLGVRRLPRTWAAAAAVATVVATAALVYAGVVRQQWKADERTWQQTAQQQQYYIDSVTAINKNLQETLAALPPQNSTLSQTATNSSLKDAPITNSTATISTPKQLENTTAAYSESAITKIKNSNPQETMAPTSASVNNTTALILTTPTDKPNIATYENPANQKLLTAKEATDNELANASTINNNAEAYKVATATHNDALAMLPILQTKEIIFKKEATNEVLKNTPQVQSKFKTWQEKIYMQTVWTGLQTSIASRTHQVHQVAGGVSLSVLPQLKVVTGIGLQSGNATTMVDTFFRERTRPIPPHEDDDLLSAEASFKKVIVPMYVSYYPLKKQYHANPYISVGVQAQKFLTNDVTYRFEDDHGGGPGGPHRPRQYAINKSMIHTGIQWYGLANVGIEARLATRWSCYFQVQYLHSIADAADDDFKQPQQWTVGAGAKYLF